MMTLASRVRLHQLAKARRYPPREIQGRFYLYDNKELKMAKKSAIIARNGVRKQICSS